jgi:glycosyltransferase involved in cell wall biosynthesis
MKSKGFQAYNPDFGPAILCLFPDILSQRFGGAELSGQLAWESIKNSTAEHGSAHLFCYSPPHESATNIVSQSETLVLSKTRAVSRLLRQYWQPQQIFIWHVGMLKLLPFVRLAGTGVVLMLLGVEAWRQHDHLTRLLLRRVNLFLSISDHTWRGFLDVYPHFAARQHQTVYLGLGQPITALSTPAEPPAALVIGRIARGEDYKGHRELIDAWPLVLQRIPSAELWIAGDGDLRPDLEHLVHKHRLGQHVRFFGQVSEEHKQELLRRCRCLAMPSRGEGFGLVYLEAMRMGRPCLVSTLDAGREVVNPPEAGLAADPGDPLALAEAVCRLLTPGAEWDRWSAQARLRYERRFTARHFQERLLQSLFNQHGERCDAAIT